MKKRIELKNYLNRHDEWLVQKDDGGLYYSITLSNDIPENNIYDGTIPDIGVTITSADQSRKHEQLNHFIGKEVKVTIEIVEKPKVEKCDHDPVVDLEKLHEKLNTSEDEIDALAKAFMDVAAKYTRLHHLNKMTGKSGADYFLGVAEGLGYAWKMVNGIDDDYNSKL